MHQRKKKWAMTAVLLAFALVSVFLLGDVLSSPQFHANTLASLEEKQTTVLELSTAATAASAAVTLLPGDAATPIAEKLADLGAGFLVVLCAIYLEKYLLTMTAWLAFLFLIPAACVLYVTYIHLSWGVLRGLARRLLVFGIASVLVIPVSVALSDGIEARYESSIQATLEQAQKATQQVEEQTREEGEQGIFSGLFSQITDGINGAAQKVGELVNRFLEALAVMLVTACVIPLLVLLFFVWLVRTTFAVELPLRFPGNGSGRHSTDGKTE